MRRVRECVTWVFLRKSSARTRQQMRSRASSGRRWFRACPEALEERWLLSTTPVLTLPVKGGPANAAQPASALVVGQQVFYNNSSFDGHLSSATAEDDAAIATDKSALLPGGSASPAYPLRCQLSVRSLTRAWSSKQPGARHPRSSLRSLGAAP